MPSLIATLGLNMSQFTAGLDSAQGIAKKHGEGIASALGEELTHKLAAFGTIVGMETYIHQTLEWASKIGDLSIRTGLAATELQALELIAKKNGTTVESLASLYERLGKAMGVATEGGPKGDKQEAALKRLGISSESIETGDMKAGFAEMQEYVQGIGSITPQIEADLSTIYKNAREAIPALKAMTKEAMEHAKASALPPELMAEMKAADDSMIEGWHNIQAAGKGIVAGLATGMNVAKDAVRAFAGVWSDAFAAQSEGKSLEFNPLKSFGKHFEDARGEYNKLAKDFAGQSPDEARLSAMQARIIKERDELGNTKEGKKKTASNFLELQQELNLIAAQRAQTGDHALSKRTDLILQLRELEIARELQAFDKNKDSVANRQKSNQDALEDKRARSADRVQKIEEQTAELKRKGDMMAMTADEKRLALRKEIAELTANVDPYGEATAEEIAQRNLEIAKRENELTGVKDDETGRAGRKDYAATELNKIGGFLGTYAAAPELAMLDVQKKSQQHLAKIEKGIDKLNATPAQGDFGDTEF